MELYPLVDAFVLHVCVHMLACVNLVSDLCLSLSLSVLFLTVDVFSVRQSVAISRVLTTQVLK